MRIVDTAKSTAWLSARGLAFGSGWVSLGFAREGSYPIPDGVAANTIIARTLAYHFTKFDESILYIDEFMVWPSAENWPLFDGYRRSIGESKPLWERPGHIFTSADTDAVFALLSMVLYFSWGAVIASSSKELVVRISHDEMIDIYAGASTRSEDDPFDDLTGLLKG